VTFVVVLVGGGITSVGVDWGVRNAEMADLLTSVEASEQAMMTAQEEIAAIASDFQQAPDPTDADREAYSSQLAAAAGRGRDAIAAAGANVQAVGIAPWHATLLRAQADYIAHNLAWQEHLDRASQDPEEFGQPQDLINSSFEEAEASMRAALPVPMVDDLQSRVDLIFAPVPTEGGQAA
jgi:hypothetical protein